jgi:hypothetical protein
VVRYVEVAEASVAEGRFEASYRASGDAFDQLDGYFEATGSATSEVPNDKVQVITGFITDLTSAGTATAIVEYWSTRFSESATATATVAPTRTGYGAFAGTEAVGLMFTPTLSHGGRFTSAVAALGGFHGLITKAGRFNTLADVTVSFSATYQHRARCTGEAAAAVALPWATAEHHKSAWLQNASSGFVTSALATYAGGFTADPATSVSLGVVSTQTHAAAFAALASTEPGLMLPFTNQNVLSARVMVVPFANRQMQVPYQLRTMVVSS